MRTAMWTRIWVDNGHGCDTPGKCSPDFRIREYQWCRDVAAGLVDMLQADCYDAALLVPEQYDVSIRNRCLRVNRTCTERGADKVLLVSIHINAAASDWRWHDAEYWSAWVYRQEIKSKDGKIIRVKEASAESKRLAALLVDSARRSGFKVSGNTYKSKNLGILRDTLCPAVLTENFFQDNRKCVDYLLTPECKSEVILSHYRAIVQYLNDK